MKTSKTMMSMIVMAVYFSIFCSVSYAVKADEFLNLPIAFIYPNGIESITDVTIDEMIRLGVKDNATKTWEQLKLNERVLTITLNDAFSGEITIIKILFIEMTNKIMFDRAIVDNQELTVGERYGLYKNLVWPIHVSKNTP